MASSSIWGGQASKKSGLTSGKLQNLGWTSKKSGLTSGKPLCARQKACAKAVHGLKDTICFVLRQAAHKHEKVWDVPSLSTMLRMVRRTGEGGEDEKENEEVIHNKDTFYNLCTKHNHIFIHVPNWNLPNAAGKGLPHFQLQPSDWNVHATQ